ncbi:ribosome recycling factor [Candidatus Marinimicrobia bacterium]|nr:ribosome recycling factor [Candidatus Neomarinimicrobiota bacterium]
MDIIYINTKASMDKVVDHYSKEISIIRTGRASKDILDIVKVDYYGSVVPLNTIANITSPDPQMIVIQPFDISSIDQVEKAIIKSDLGMNPNNDGKVIRLTVPPLTEERRSDLMKLVHKLIEDGKVSIRNVRRESNEKLKTSEKNHEISEDDLKRSLDNIQEITNEYIDKLNELQKSKEKEILF